MTLPLINPYLELRHALAHQNDAFQLEVRKKLIWAYAWGVPTTQAIHAIAALSPMIELGAGTGYWAWLITQAGGKIRAFDRAPEAVPHWVYVEKAEPSDLSTAPENTLFLCWPPLDEPMADDALANFRGDHLAYVGEWRGRTANAAFHDRLERDWNRDLTISLPSWPGYRDELLIYSRK